MKNLREFGPLYQYGNNFLVTPSVYDYIRLYQEGEMYNCYGYVISEHVQICAEISYIISGSGFMFGSGREYEVKAGDFFLNCPGEKHYIIPKNQENLRYFYLGFTLDEEKIQDNPELMAMWRFYARPHVLPISQCRYDTVSLMSRLNNEFYNGGVLSSLAIECLLKQILVDVYRSFNSPRERPGLASAEEPTVAVGNTIYSAVRYIDAHIFEITRIQEIAQELGYSNSYLSHLFRDKMGLTIQQYLTSKKIEKSRELIAAGNLNLTQISEQLNYDSLQSFSRAFKRIMGISPTAYMKSPGEFPTAQAEGEKRE